MSSTDGNEPATGPIQTSEPLSRAIGERYLTYALSTIMHRALPDARDGLKPVHRRILFAMRELKLSSTGGFRKSAKISGDVMGNYHPHGDAAIYDAMARLAQDFNVRYPLVDGQGNFGNIDGDNPAASRYTEARLTAASEALMEGLAENAVDFRPNYDGTLEEPVVLPAAFPNLLANGASGIAVGMATNIPPHNLHELIDACVHLANAKNSDLVRDDTLIEMVKGPDFPTGGVIVEPQASIREAYLTGRGSFRTRARWQVEDLGRGTWQIVVTEIPYQVQKSKLIERLAEVIQTKKVPLLADVRDESADDIRIVLEPRSKNVEPEMLMGMLFRNSDLETRFSLNMNVLIDGRTPKVCSLKEVLRAFLSHRQDVLIRRSRHRIDKIDHRLEVLEGFITAFLNLDRVIDIIRYDADPKAALMAEDWAVKRPRATSEADYVSPLSLPHSDDGLTEVQAEAILNMRLRSLRRLEEMELLKEQDALMRERAELDDLIGSETLQWKKIAGELRDIQKQFGKDVPGGARRTFRRRRRGRGGAAGGDDAARADYGHLFEDGLDPRHEGASAAGRGGEVQGRRRGAVHFPRRDDRQDPAGGQQRALLHPSGHQPARRAGHGRTGAPDGRPAERGGDRRPADLPGGREAACRIDRRGRIRCRH